MITQTSAGWHDRPGVEGKEGFENNNAYLEVFMVTGIHIGNSLSLLGRSGGVGLQYAFDPSTRQPHTETARVMAAHALATMTAGQPPGVDHVWVNRVFRLYRNAFEAEVDTTKRALRIERRTDLVVESLEDTGFLAGIDRVLKVFLGDSFSGKEDVAEWNNPKEAVFLRSDWKEIAHREGRFRFFAENIQGRINRTKTGTMNPYTPDAWLEIQGLVHLLGDVFALSPTHPLGQLGALRARIENAFMHGSAFLVAAVELWEGEMVRDLMLKAAKHLATSKWTGLSQDEKQDALIAIRKVLINPEFQRDPVAYTKNLFEKRGHTEERRLPDDVVLSFLKEIFLEEA